MKFYVFSDAHLGASRYNIPWFESILKDTFKAHLEKSKDLNVDAILFCGDLFDSPFVGSDTILFVIQQLKRIGLPFLSIIGNHDLQTGRPIEESPLSILNESVENFKLIHNKNYVFNDINIIGVSYISPNTLLEYKGHKVLSPFEEYLDSSTFNLAMLHQDVTGLEYSRYISTTLDADELTMFDFSLLGHYHNRVEQDHFIYVGSVYPLSFKQAEVEKGAYLVEITNNYDLQFTFLEYQPNKRLKEVSVTLDEIENALKDLVGKYHVVRVIISVKEEELALAQSHAKELRKKYMKEFDKLVFDFRITDIEDDHDDIDVSEFYQHEAVLNKLYKKYDKDFVDKFISLVDTYTVTYKTQNKVIQEITALLNTQLEEYCNASTTRGTS